MLLRIVCELDRLKILSELLHERGLVPTDLYVLAELQARRNELRRAQRAFGATAQRTEELQRLDVQIEKLTAGASL